MENTADIVGTPGETVLLLETVPACGGKNLTLQPINRLAVRNADSVGQQLTG
jgi:hypothetical protein